MEGGGPGHFWTMSKRKTLFGSGVFPSYTRRKLLTWAEFLSHDLKKTVISWFPEERFFKQPQLSTVQLNAIISKSSSRAVPELLGAPVLLYSVMGVNQPQEPDTLHTAQVHQQELVLACFTIF